MSRRYEVEALVRQYGAIGVVWPRHFVVEASSSDAARIAAIDAAHAERLEVLHAVAVRIVPADEVVS